MMILKISVETAIAKSAGMMRWVNIAHQYDAFASHFPLFESDLRQPGNLARALAREVSRLIEPRWSIRLILHLEAKADLFRRDPRGG